MAVILLSGAAALAAEGSIRGTVTLTGAGGDPSRVVVYVPDFDQPAPGGAVGGRIRQKDKQYLPDVLPIVKGQSVEFDNEDPFLHNVFSSSRAAGPNGMDLGKYKGPGRSKSWRFDRTGIVDVYCDIHESMVATVLVLPNPAFARPDAAGRFQIDHLPPGHHVLYAWARRGQKATLEVDVKPGQITELPPISVSVAGGGDAHKDKYGQDYAGHPKAYGE